MKKWFSYKQCTNKSQTYYRTRGKETQGTAFKALLNSLRHKFYSPAPPGLSTLLNTPGAIHSFQGPLDPPPWVYWDLHLPSKSYPQPTPCYLAIHSLFCLLAGAYRLLAPPPEGHVTGQIDSCSPHSLASGA